MHYDLPLGHPNFGKVFRCECTLPAWHALQQVRALEASNLTVRMRYQDFMGYRVTSANRKAHNAMQAFADAPVGWIVLTGGRGMGKTHLMAAVANSLLDNPPKPEHPNAPATKRGRSWPLYVVVPDFLAYVRTAFDRETGALSDDAEQRIQRAIDADVLLLDDLGAESRSAWTDETLYRILNARYNQTAPTIIATNEPLHRLEPRIASRMQERRFSMVVGMVGPDERLRLPTESEAQG